MISVLFISFLCGHRVSDHYHHCNTAIAFSVEPKALLVIVFTTVLLSPHQLASSLKFALVYPGTKKEQLAGEVISWEHVHRDFQRTVAPPECILTSSL